MKMIECKNQDGQDRAVDIDPDSRAYGWVHYKHADGVWVTLRIATQQELNAAIANDIVSQHAAQFARLFNQPSPATAPGAAAPYEPTQAMRDAGDKELAYMQATTGRVTPAQLWRVMHLAAPPATPETVQAEHIGIKKAGEIIEGVRSGKPPVPTHMHGLSYERGEDCLICDPAPSETARDGIYGLLGVPAGAPRMTAEQAFAQPSDCVSVPDLWREVVAYTLAFMVAHNEHDPDCDLLEFDEEGRHRDCNCGLDEATNALRALLAGAIPEEKK